MSGVAELESMLEPYAAHRAVKRKHEYPAKRNVLEGIAIGIGATSLSFVLGYLVGWVTEVNWLEVFAVFTSYVCTWLCVRERRINYVWGVVTTAAYCVLFYQWGLLASAILNAYLVPTLIYGWFRWGKDSTAPPVRHVQIKWIPVYLGVTALVYLGARWVVDAAGGTFATWDAVILVGTILAQFLLDNKRIETWYIWAVVNVAAIYVYFSTGLALAGFQYILFLINTVIGFVIWNRSMKATSAVTA